MDYRYGSHTVYKIEYHFVWVTKYRYHVLKGEVGERVREAVRGVSDLEETLLGTALLGAGVFLRDSG